MTERLTWNLFATIPAAVLLAAAVLPGHTMAEVGDSMQVRALADRYYDFRLSNWPEQAYFYGIEIERHDGLSDNSPEARAKQQATEDRLWMELKDIDESNLRGSVDWITYGILQQSLESTRDLRVCRNELWGVSQMSGWHLGLTRLAELQPVGTPEFRTQALVRWAKVPVWIDREIRALKSGLEAGYSAPKSAVRRVIEQFDGLLAMPLEQSPLASPANRDEDGEFSQKFLALIQGEILPAAGRYRDFLKAIYLDQARAELSVTANPDGRACYEASLRSYTTLDRGPEEVFELGSRTVAANRARVETLGKAAYGLDDFTDVMDRIKNDADDKFGSREELLEFSKVAVKRAQEAMPAWFGHVPRRQARVEPHPAYQDGTGVSARYEPGTETRPGIYRITLFEPEKQSRGGAEATAFHEVWPGHHLQVAIAQEIEGLHAVTKISWYSGMGEGWARYSESLAAEMGLYQTVTGPIARLAWPARGMVVDPGIHIKGWTREQAIEFMGRAGRMTDTELEEMVDRIAVLPGQLTSYDSGGLEIFALRALAEERLGEDFDIRVFHDRVLENGTVPLEMLRAHIENWLVEQAE